MKKLARIVAKARYVLAWALLIPAALLVVTAHAIDEQTVLDALESLER